MSQTAQEGGEFFFFFFSCTYFSEIYSMTKFSIKLNYSDGQLLQYKLFLPKPKETMNGLHDENWRRSQKERKCLQCFKALRLRLVSISSALAGFKEKNG